MIKRQSLGILCTVICALGACSKNTDRCPDLPPSEVYIDLYVDIPTDNPSAEGYVIKKGVRAGYGGVVVVPSWGEGSYRAFEMSAPHLPRGQNTILSVADDGMRAVCPADGSEFMLSNGMPLSSGKKISPCGLIEYSVWYDSVQRVIMVRN